MKKFCTHSPQNQECGKQHRMHQNIFKPYKSSNLTEVSFNICETNNQTKPANDSNRHFPKEDIKMIMKPLTRCSESSVNKDV